MTYVSIMYVLTYVSFSHELIAAQTAVHSHSHAIFRRWAKFGERVGKKPTATVIVKEQL